MHRRVKIPPALLAISLLASCRSGESTEFKVIRAYSECRGQFAAKFETLSGVAGSLSTDERLKQLVQAVLKRQACENENLSALIGKTKTGA